MTHFGRTQKRKRFTTPNFTQSPFFLLLQIHRCFTGYKVGSRLPKILHYLTRLGCNGSTYVGKLRTNTQSIALVTPNKIKMSEILESYKKRKIEWALKIGTEFPLHNVKQQASEQYEFLFCVEIPSHPIPIRRSAW